MVQRRDIFHLTLYVPRSIKPSQASNACGGRSYSEKHSISQPLERLFSPFASNGDFVRLGGYLGEEPR
jgi:hypothetical protein